MKVRIGTRGSPLALAQAREVQSKLAAAHGIADDDLPIVAIKTSGDRIQDRPLSEAGGKGLFTKEIEEALYAREIDVAVHSMKDLPAELPAGFVIGAVLARSEPRDAFVSEHLPGWSALTAEHRVGTSSLRRQAQLLERFPGVEVVPLRGNVGTRLRKLDAREFDAAVLAAAGLDRLGLADRVRERLAPSQMLPAVGQGAIGVEVRAADAAVLDRVAPLQDGATARCVAAERAMSERLGGSCQLPLAGHATIESGQLHLRALIARPDGSEVIRAECRGATADAEWIGREAAERLLEQGGDAILESLSS